MLSLRNFISFVFIVGFGLLAQAQPEHPFTFLKKVKRANTSSMISYDYSIKLINEAGKLVDSSSGSLIRNGADYLDSNNTTLTVVAEGYYVSINNHYRTATIISLDTIKKVMGKSWNIEQDNIIAIPDSMILKYGKVGMETLDNGNYRIVLTFENMQYRKIMMLIQQTSLRMLSMELESDDGSGFTQLYTIRNMRHEANQAKLGVKRFFTMNNNKAVLNKNFSGYNIKTITN